MTVLRNEFSLHCRRRMNNLLGFSMTSLARHGIGEEWTPIGWWVVWRRYFIIRLLKLSLWMLYADVTFKLAVIPTLCSLAAKMELWKGRFVNIVRSPRGWSCACVVVCREFEVNRYRKIYPSNTTKVFIGYTGQIISTRLWVSSSGQRLNWN
jgi:hypothetical protein